jgi:hypothetical protein
MFRYLLVTALMAAISVPAMAAKRHYYNGRGPNQCRIVNVAPHYTQTIVRKGGRVYVTRELARQDMAIICKD